jgi:exopolysaccharide biosynthesis polyprenyl glycosylphosphotransferase
MKSSRKPRQVFILFVDIAIFLLALYLALIVRYGALPTLEEWWTLCKSFVWSWLIWIILYYTIDLYNLDIAFDDPRFAGRLFGAVAGGALVSALMFYLDISSRTPKTILALYAVFLYALLWLWRFWYGRFSRLYLPRRSTAFVGVDETVAEIVDAIESHRHLGYEAAAFLDEAGTAPPGFRHPTCRDRSEFIRAVEERDVSLIVVADESRLSEETRRALFDLIDKPVRFMHLPEFYELFLRRIPIGTINDLWFLENIDLQAKRKYEIFKRIFDITVSLALVLVSMVVLLIIALAVRLSGPGPILFRQVRLGRGGRRFDILKFRTMRTDRNDFAPTGANDPRITAVGDFLRKSRLDEIPQMINILGGDMSFVGPRPERPELAVDLERSIPYYRQRLLVKPGVTGWDQVSGEYHSPSIADTYKKLQYDLYYVKNMSITLDASIFFKTIKTVFRHKGR